MGTAAQTCARPMRTSAKGCRADLCTLEKTTLGRQGNVREARQRQGDKATLARQGSVKETRQSHAETGRRQRDKATPERQGNVRGTEGKVEAGEDQSKRPREGKRGHQMRTGMARRWRWQRRYAWGETMERATQTCMRLVRAAADDRSCLAREAKGHSGTPSAGETRRRPKSGRGDDAL